MIDRRLEIRQSLPETHNEHLLENQAYTSQTTVLTLKNGTHVAEVNAYLDDGYYAFHWQTTKPEDELVHLAEECVEYYEEHYPDCVPCLIGEQTDPFGGGKLVEGVILFVRENGQSDKLELDYQRPLSWEQIAGAASGREVTLARFNTPIGDFCVRQFGESRSFGVISHLKETAGFTNLLVKSASVDVTPRQSEELLQQAISAFPENS